MILDHQWMTAAALMDAGIPHTIMEYLILTLFGGGGLWKAYAYRQNKNGNDKFSSKIREAVTNAINAEAVVRASLFKKHIKEAHEPLLAELKDLCGISEKTYAELHTYIEIQKDRDRRGRQGG